MLSDEAALHEDQQLLRTGGLEGVGEAHGGRQGTQPGLKLAAKGETPGGSGINCGVADDGGSLPQSRGVELLGSSR